MIITDKFVFIHMPKTAGMFVRDLILEVIPDAKKNIDHNLRANLPDDAKQLPVFGFVRNPWDWYVSWYYYFKQRKDCMLFNLNSKNGERDFKTVITRLLYFEEVTDGMSETLNPSYDYGYYTWRLNMLFSDEKGQKGQHDDVKFGRFENLREQLLDILASYGVTLTNDIVGKVMERDKTNTSSHSSYQEYYDDELAELVAKREKLFIDKFGYTF